MATITQRIAQYISKFLPQSNPPTSSDELPLAKQSFVKLLNQQSEIQNQQARLRACRAMYDTDSRIWQPINRFSSDLIGTGFTVTVTFSTHPPDKQKAQDIIDATIKRLNLNSAIVSYLIDAQVNGNSYIELSYDKSGLIQQLSSKPQMYFFRNTNDSDQFTRRDRAFYYSEYASYLNRPSDNDTSVIWFWDFQVIHLRANYIGKGKYGNPTFGSAVSAWEKLQRGEANVDLNRAKFSQMIKVHKLVNYSQKDVDDYIERNQTALDEPFAVASEYFVTGEGGIEVLNSGNGGLGEINDLQHFLLAVEVASPTPTTLMNVMQFSSGLSGDRLFYELAAYYKTVLSTRSWVIDGFIKPLINWQLASLGIFPDSIDYEIDFNDEADLRAIINKGLAINQTAQPTASAEVVADV